MTLDEMTMVVSAVVAEDDIYEARILHGLARLFPGFAVDHDELAYGEGDDEVVTRYRRVTVTETGTGESRSFDTDLHELASGEWADERNPLWRPAP